MTRTYPSPAEAHGLANQAEQAEPTTATGVERAVGTPRPAKNPHTAVARLAMLLPIVLLLAAVLAIATLPRLCRGEVPIAETLAAPPPAAPLVAEPAATNDQPSPERVAATPPPPPPAEPADAATFAAMVDDLVAIGTRTAVFAQADDHAAASRSDDEARATFAVLMERFPDAGERALAMAIPLPAPSTTADEAIGRRTVLHLVLAADCARRHANRMAAHDDGTPVDALVHAALDALPSGHAAQDVAGRALADQPYLHAVHEPAVLGLVQQAAAGTFPRALATKLLLTLWDNVQRRGERSSEELSLLALSWLGGDDVSRRTAACRQLLGDDRYRALVVSWLRERNDRAVAAELALVAAAELEAPVALELLRELTPLLPRAPNAYLVLGFRAPEALADAYRALLASNTQTQVRADLVTGVGMTTTPLGLDVAKLALANDPSPDVRIQALFALTARREHALAEAALNQVLDDPHVAQDPTRLGAVVLALQNLEAADDPNVMQRVGQRLQSLPLAGYSRQLLAGLLARAVPADAGGQRPGGQE